MSWRKPTARRRGRPSAPRPRVLTDGSYSVPVYECRLERTRRLRSPRAYVVSSLGAALVAREAIGRGDRERFVVLSLRADGRLLGVDVTSVGSIDRVEVDVRSVFRSAVLLNAESLVVAHNHCGEEVRPSRYDRQVTRRLTAAAYVLGFEVADSLIVGPHADYYSFRDRGEMPWQRRSRRRRARP